MANEKAYKICKSHPVVATSYFNIGFAYNVNNELLEAEEYYKICLKMR